MKCYRRRETRDACTKKATMYVAAYGTRAWSGYFCDKHVGVIVRLRMRHIKKYKQNVVLRPITARDRKQVKR